MNAFAAESAAAAVQAAANKIRDAGREVSGHSQAIAWYSNTGQPQSKSELVGRVASIRKGIFAAEKAVEELNAALKSITTEDANA